MLRGFCTWAPIAVGSWMTHTHAKSYPQQDKSENQDSQLIPCFSPSIGSNLGLKFSRERSIRVLSPHLAESKIYK